jgi:hypothetical protein
VIHANYCLAQVLIATFFTSLFSRKPFSSIPFPKQLPLVDSQKQPFNKSKKQNSVKKGLVLAEK